MQNVELASTEIEHVALFDDARRRRRADAIGFEHVFGMR